MRNTTKLLLVLSCINVFSSTSRAASVGADEKTEPLRVISALPQAASSRVDPWAYIQITFNGPITVFRAPTDQAPVTGITINPSVKGHWRPIGQDAIEFTPEKSFEINTEYSVSIQKGFRSDVTGKFLDNTYSWKFRTVQFHLESVEDSNEYGITQKMPVYFKFNQGVDLEACRSAMTVSPPLPFDIHYADSVECRRFDLYWRQDSNALLYQDRIVKFSPKEPWKHAEMYSLTINGNLKPTLGNLSLGRDTVVKRRTIGDLVFKSLLQDQGDTLIIIDSVAAPDKPLFFNFSNHIDWKTQRGHISFSPKIVIDSTDESAPDTKVRIDKNLSALINYTVTFDAGLTDIFGTRLGAKVIRRFSTNAFMPTVRILSDDWNMDSHGHRCIPVYYCNMDSIDLDLVAPPLEAVEKWLAYKNAFDSLLAYANREGWPVCHIRKAPDTTRNRGHFWKLPLDTILHGKPGFVAARLFRNNNNNSRRKWRRTSADTMVSSYMASNIGLTIQKGNGEYRFYATRLDKTVSLPSAAITIRSSLGQMLWSGKTDRQGCAVMPPTGEFWKRPWNNESPTPYVIVSCGEDWSLATLCGRYETPSPKKIPLSVKAFVDRGIYLPGDTVRCIAFVRADDDSLVVPRGLRVCLSVWNGHSNTPQDTVALSALGSIDYAFPIPQDARLGRYKISGEVMGNDTLGEKQYENRGFYVSFIVGEFRPNSVACYITTTKDTFFVGDTVGIRISGRYLYDAPFANAHVQMRLVKQNWEFSSAIFKGYSFAWMAEDGDEKACSKDIEGHYMLDSAGKYTFKTLLTDTTFRGAFTYQIRCDLQSTHDNVSGSKRIVVHPGHYYIGLKPHAYYCEVGETQTIDAATVTVDGKPVAIKDLKATVFRRAENNWNGNGKDARDSVVWSGKFSTNASGVGSFRFTPRTSGDYRIVVSGNPARIATSVDISAYQTESKRASADTALSLLVDKKEYCVGDTVQVILSNLLRKGRALVTTERDHVFTTKWIDIAPNASKIKIPILPVHRRGFWISVAVYYGGKTPLVAAPKSDEPCGPQWVSEHVFVNVTWGEKALAISLAPDKQVYAPGNEVIVKCTIADMKSSQHEVIIWAEDEGVLSLTGYKPPDILNTMYSMDEYERGVSLSDTRESLVKTFRPILDERIAEPKFMKGGALGLTVADVSARDAISEAKARRHFSMRPLFLSSVRLDARGQALVCFRLPDNLTQFRIMAVAATDDGRFGNTDTSIIVTKPLFLRPIAPLSLRTSDTVRIGGVVENLTESVDTPRVTMIGKGFSLMGPASVRMAISPRSRKDFFVTAVVDSQIDTAKMLLTAVSPQDSDAVETSMAVAPFRFPESATICGTVTKNKNEKILQPLRHDLRRSTLSAEVTNTIVGDLKGSFEYLENYPYDCAEQLTSRILPLFLCKDLLKKEAGLFFTDSLIREKVTAYFRALPEYRARIGGFSYWKGGAESSPYLTAYILFALYRAIDCGYRVDNDLLYECWYSLIRYLRDPKSRNDYDWYAQQCYAAGVLSEHRRYQKLAPKEGQIIDSLVDCLPPLHASGSVFAKVNILRILRNRGNNAPLRGELVSQIRSGLVREPLYAYFDEPSAGASMRWHQTPIRTTALILQTFLENGEEIPAMDRIVQWLLLQKAKIGHWGTTQNNAYALWALSTYARMKEPPAAACDAGLFLDGAPVLSHSFKGGTARDRIDWSRPFSAIAPTAQHTLLFKKSGEGSLYYTLHMSCLPLDPVKPFDAGMRIQKTYATLDGRPLSPDSLRYREIVLVTTTVSTPRERQYVVIDDPIPAGCEIVNEAFNTVEQAVKEGVRMKSREFYFGWKTWNTFEYRKEGCRVFATRLRPGDHTFTYAVRPIARGSFHLPPAHVEEMYSPEVYGRTGEGMATVR